MTYYFILIYEKFNFYYPVHVPDFGIILLQATGVEKRSA